MSYGYGASNPFDQRDSPAGGPGGYGAPAQSYNQPQRPAPAQFGQGPRPAPAMGRDDYGSGNVEMASLAQNAGSFGQGDPNFVLNECRSIDEGVGQIENNLNQLRMLQERSLNEADGAGSQTQRQLDQLSSETMAMYRTLTDRVRKVKSRPEAQQARNTSQVNRVDRRLKQAITSYQQIESGFRQKSRDQLERQYRYVRPDADEREVRDAVEDAANGGGQIFQQALMQSDRRGQARSVLNAVQDRHEQLKKIEQQMIELAQLFQDMDTLIVQQEVQVAQIEQKGEEVVENLDKGNEEIGVAVETAKKTRKKKWICLGIVIAIVLIIAIIITIYFLVINPPKASTSNNSSSTTNTKRGLEIRGVDFLGERPVTTIYAQSKIVAPDADADATAPLSGFVGKEIDRRYVVTGTEMDQGAEKASVGNNRIAETPTLLSTLAGKAKVGRRYVVTGTEMDQGVDKASVGNTRIAETPTLLSTLAGKAKVGRRYVITGTEMDGGVDKASVGNNRVAETPSLLATLAGKAKVGRRYVTNGDDTADRSPLGNGNLVGADSSSSLLTGLSKVKVDRRYVVTGTGMDKSAEKGPLANNVVNLGASGGGRFTFDSLAAGKAKRFVLPGGRAFDEATATLVRGRNLRTTESQ